MMFQRHPLNLRHRYVWSFFGGKKEDEDPTAGMTREVKRRLKQQPRARRRVVVAFVIFWH